VDKLRGGGDGNGTNANTSERRRAVLRSSFFRSTESTTVKATPFFADDSRDAQKLFPTTRYPWSVPADCLRLPDAAPNRPCHARSGASVGLMLSCSARSGNDTFRPTDRLTRRATTTVTPLDGWLAQIAGPVLTRIRDTSQDLVLAMLFLLGRAG